jgi:cytochrome c biogenesis protein CcdA
MFGLLASCNPCSISMLPLTLAYLGTSDIQTNTATTKKAKTAVDNDLHNKFPSKSIFYAFGLSSVTRTT